MWDPRSDAWFAGFADGEGCFLISVNPRPRWGRPSVHPRFSLNLRADDRAVLRALSEAFGGKLSVDRRSQGKVGASAPRIFWHVVTKVDMLRLVEYFDQFPLRAKKARDYALWREAVLLYAERGGADAYAELMALRVALMDGRAYAAAAAEDLLVEAETATAEAARDGL